MSKLNTRKTVDSSLDFTKIRVQSIFLQYFHPNFPKFHNMVCSLLKIPLEKQPDVHVKGVEIGLKLQQFVDKSSKQITAVDARSESSLALVCTLSSLLHLVCLHNGYHAVFWDFLQRAWAEGLANKGNPRMDQLTRLVLNIFHLEARWHTSASCFSLDKGKDPSDNWLQWVKASKQLGDLLRAMHKEHLDHARECVPGPLCQRTEHRLS